MNPLMSFTRGAIGGATGGLDIYPGALMMQGLDKLVGEGKLTYEEALRLLREQRAQDVETNPISSTAGGIAGAFVPLSRLSGAGKLIAGNTALGAAQGFSSNAAEQGTTLQDTAMGAGIGATLGALGAGTSKILTSLADTAVVNGIYSKLMKDAGAKKLIREELKAGGMKKPLDADVREVARRQADEMLKTLTPAERVQSVVQPQRDVSTLARRGVGRAVGGIVAPTGVGAGVGALTSLVSGQDPIASAVTGGLGTLALAKSQAAANLGKTLTAETGRLLATKPGLAKAPAILGGLPATPLAQRLTTQEPLPEEFRATPAETRRSSGAVQVEGDYSDLEQYRVQSPRRAHRQGPDDYSDLDQYRAK